MLVICSDAYWIPQYIETLMKDCGTTKRCQLKARIVAIRVETFIFEIILPIILLLTHFLLGFLLQY